MRIQGLDEVDIKASLASAGVILGLSIAGHGDQKKSTPVVPRTKPAREFVSINAGQSNVE